MKKSTVLSLTLIILLSLSLSKDNSYAKYNTSNDINIVVNNHKVKFDREPVIVNDPVLLPAKELIEKLGGSISWFKEKNYFNMTYKGKTISMGIKNKLATIDGKKYSMDCYPVLFNETVMIPIRFTAQKLNFNIDWDNNTRSVQISNKYISNSTQNIKANNSYNVVIDPGHGGRDKGAYYFGVKESYLNLKIAKNLKSKLKKSGINVYMTRESDKYVSLYSRSALASKVHADFLISIHHNAGRKSDYGVLTLYSANNNYTNGDLDSFELANIIQSSLSLALKTRDNGVISRPELAVLRTSKVPSIIAEIGYMTNYKELKKLKSNSYSGLVASTLEASIQKALNSTN